MLPTGHIAAGYLTAEALLHFAHPAVTPEQKTQLLWWGVFWGFAPDIDVFYYFFSNKTLLVAGGGSKKDHRSYLSHAPILWLIAGLLIYFFAGSIYLKYIGLLLWLGSWSHFLLDSIDYGIMWLWPFDKKIYALFNQNVKRPVSEKNFFAHVWKYLKLYTKMATFYLEIIVIVTALIVYFK